MLREEFLAEYRQKITRKSSGKSKVNLESRMNCSKKLRLEYLLAIKANVNTDFSSKVEEFTQPGDTWYLADGNKAKLFYSIVHTRKPKLILKYSVESVYAVFLSQGWFDNDHAHHSHSVDTATALTALTQQPPMSALVCPTDTLIDTNESSNLIPNRPFVSPHRKPTLLR